MQPAATLPTRDTASAEVAASPSPRLTDDTAEPPAFQEIVMRLQAYWAGHGCLIWQPTNTEVGAGTNNPATFLRVLGPEPWRVAYVEPSVRPDDSRYGQNPNRIQMHTQFQVILKPGPNNPQELYLGSLAVLGIDPKRHDVRFVEDNWEWPAGGAWGLGWEVWLDGQEITQFTYFQQTGGIALDPVAVEITYGLERIAMALQGVRHFKDIRYAPGAPGMPDIAYGELFGPNEVEMSTYNLELANTGRLTDLFRLYEDEANVLLAAGLVLPAYSYVLKTSHTFNLLDARGAVGVAERARYLGRVRELARRAAEGWRDKRRTLGYPLGRADSQHAGALFPREPATSYALPAAALTADLVLEVGTEELPAADVDSAVAHLAQRVPDWLGSLRLAHGDVRVAGTPRRLAVRVAAVQAMQRDETQVIKGPPARVAFDAAGSPTGAAEGFARSKGIPVTDLRPEEVEGGTYAVAHITVRGRPAAEVLAEALPPLIGGFTYPRSMRWNVSNVAFSRPIRWLVALLGEQVVPLAYAGVISGRTSRGLRPAGSPSIDVSAAATYDRTMAAAGIVLDPSARAAAIRGQCHALAQEIGGIVPDDPALLAEVANLVEAPAPLRGAFDPRHLALPREVLVTVMRKHQRYFPIERDGRLLPAFIAVANGPVDPDAVRHGNEQVLAARFADAAFFWEHDRRTPLEERLPALEALTFQARLGSMRDKSRRIERLTTVTGRALGLDPTEAATAERIAHLAKADLVTHMVTELTSLQGVMGREYARLDGEPEPVAAGIFEHYLPRYAGDTLPTSRAAIAVGIADRLDTLVGLFAAGLAPRATADPFALRRTALGLVHTLAERGLDLGLRGAVAEAAAIQPITAGDSVQEQVLTFIRRRLEQWLLDQGFRHDVVQAVLAARSDRPATALSGVRELAALVDATSFQTILTAYARAARLVRGQVVPAQVDPSLFDHDAERVLWSTLQQVQTAITPDLTVDGLVRHLDPLVAPIDSFFQHVFVMVEDDRVRLNRLALLKQIADLPNGIADLTQLRGF